MRAGEVTFDEFSRHTSERWTQIAEVLHGRWDVPTWYSAEDVRQEVLLAAWLYGWRFNAPTASRNVEHFAVWNGLHAAIKSATKARIGHRPHRGEGREIMSCYEIPASALARAGDEDDERDISERASVPATQEDVVLRRVFFERMSRKARGAERIALCALAAYGSAECAASAIYDDEGTRWLLRIGNEADAEAIVRAAIENLVVCVRSPATCSGWMASSFTFRSTRVTRLPFIEMVSLHPTSRESVVCCPVSTETSCVRATSGRRGRKPRRVVRRGRGGMMTQETP
jgi:hypothetical protein